MSLSLYHMTADYREALASLADSEIDAQTLADTIEGLTGELTVKAANVAAFAMNLEAEADAAKAAEDRISKHRKGLEAKAKQLREYLLRNMTAAGISEIAALDNSFRVRVMQGREACVIDDDGALPTEFIRTKVVSEPNKVAITEAIKGGADVPGARLERKPTLKID